MFENSESAVTAISEIDAVPTILDVVCKTTGMGFAAVARVTEDRWIACGVRDDIAFGLAPGGELKLETTICHEIRQHRQPVVIDNVSEDPVFSSHHTPEIYGLQSYISMPIVLPDGSFFGTLCAIDVIPRKLKTPEILGMFKLFAELIAFHLDSLNTVSEAKAQLENQKVDTGLREQFIAVLGHDLRNPLASIDAGMRTLQRSPLDERGKTVVTLVQSSVRRMAALIDDVLDFARGRLGDGLSADKVAGVALPAVLRQVIEEICSASPDCTIEVVMEDVTVDCDPARIAQLFSNLLANAVSHGVKDGVIRVHAHVVGESFELSVANGGQPIPEEKISHLFKPFVRASSGSSQAGLGLGLYIAAEIARVHQGELTVTSSAEETCFTLRMPRFSVSV